MAVTRGKGNQNVRKAQKSSQYQAIVVVVALFVILFVLWTIIESNYGPITPEAIGKGLLLALPIPGLVAVTVFFSWRSRNRASARLLESFGLDAEKADLSDPAWFVTKDYPPVLLHESMFSRDKAVAYHKETIEPGAMTSPSPRSITRSTGSMPGARSEHADCQATTRFQPTVGPSSASSRFASAGASRCAVRQSSLCVIQPHRASFVAKLHIRRAP